MNIKDAIEDFINYCVFEKGLSDKTKESYENDLKVYSEFLKENNIEDIENIKSEHIKDFLKARENEESLEDYEEIPFDAMYDDGVESIEYINEYKLEYTVNGQKVTGYKL